MNKESTKLIKKTEPRDLNINTNKIGIIPISFHQNEFHILILNNNNSYNIPIFDKYIDTNIKNNTWLSFIYWIFKTYGLYLEYKHLELTSFIRVDDVVYFLFNIRSTSHIDFLVKINQYHIIKYQQFEIVPISRLYKISSSCLYKILVKLQSFCYDTKITGIVNAVPNRICLKMKIGTNETIDKSIINKSLFKYAPDYTISDIIDNHGKLYICVIKDNIEIDKIKYNNCIMTCPNDLGEYTLPYIDLKNIDISFNNIIKKLFPLHDLTYSDIFRMYKLNYLYLYVNYLALVYIGNSSLKTVNKNLFPGNSRKNIRWIIGNNLEDIMLTTNCKLVINEVIDIIDKQEFGYADLFNKN